MSWNGLAVLSKNWSASRANKLIVVACMEIDKGKIIKRQQMDNGTEIVLRNYTRRMGADRWIVELQCVAYIPIGHSYWNMAANEEELILTGIKKKLGNRLVQTFTKKRIFVPDEECEPLLQEMLQQAYSGMMEYLKKPNFPLKLFKKQYHDARQKLLLQQAMSHVTDD